MQSNNNNNNSIVTDPKVFGPGMWMTLHILGYNSNTLSQSKNFLYILTPIIKKIPCKKCRIHALLFINETDYGEYMNEKNRQGLYIGPFRYVFDMHNNANRLLGKSIMNWREAYSLYDDLETVCIDGPCMDTDDIIDIKHDINNYEYEKIKTNIIESIDPQTLKVIFTKGGKIINT